MNIVDAMHKQDMLHNDLSSNNIMLHFPKHNDGAIYIAIGTWRYGQMKKHYRITVQQVRLL